MAEEGVHQALEGLGCVSKPKWHGNILPEAKRSHDGCLGNVVFSYWNLMISLDQIHHRKNCAAIQSAREILQVRLGRGYLSGLVTKLRWR